MTVTGRIGPGERSAVDQAVGTGFATLLAFAHRLADRAAPEILPHFREPIPVVDKSHEGAFDPVTAADRDAERALREEVARHHPEHGFIGEEMGDVRPAARRTAT